jgi:hypothetical protein
MAVGFIGSLIPLFHALAVIAMGSFACIVTITHRHSSFINEVRK